MNEIYDSLKCLCNSPLRFQILNALDDTQMDLRSLKDELESPRTTLQRNLSILKKRKWIKETHSGYTVTTAGSLILEKIVALDETLKTINIMSSFLQEVDAPSTLDIEYLRDVHVTVPKPTQPNAPMKRILNTFDGADHVRGFLPVISWLLVNLSRQVDGGSTIEHEYVISRNALNGLQKQDVAERVDISGANQPVRIDIYVYEDTLPYGLFIAEDRLMLTAYDEMGRIHALVESENKTAIKWGEQAYKNYKHRSQLPCETEVPHLIHEAGIAD